MPQTAFDRDTMAKWYAKEHLKTDPGIRLVGYLPKNAPEREIRFIEVNDLIGELRDDALEPIDFGVDTGMENEHKLFVLDVTPGQWERNRNIRSMRKLGRQEWYTNSGYSRRSLVENTVFRYKSILGQRMRSRSLGNQRVEVSLACKILNTMTSLGRPDSYRVT